MISAIETSLWTKKGIPLFNNLKSSILYLFFNQWINVLPLPTFAIIVYLNYMEVHTKPDCHDHLF